MEERDYSDIEETGRELSDPTGPLPPEGEPGKAKRYLGFGFRKLPWLCWPCWC